MEPTTRKCAVQQQGRFVIAQSMQCLMGARASVMRIDVVCPVLGRELANDHIRLAEQRRHQPRQVSVLWGSPQDGPDRSSTDRSNLFLAGQPPEPDHVAHMEHAPIIRFDHIGHAQSSYLTADGFDAQTEIFCHLRA
jgi:hypothetical protein